MEIFDDASSNTKWFDDAKVTINYPWVEGDPHTILLISENGIITEATIDAATLTPEFSWDNVLNYGFIGFYVGIVPITLGLLWYPFMKRMKKSGLMQSLHLLLDSYYSYFLERYLTDLKSGLKLLLSSKETW